MGQGISEAKGNFPRGSRLLSNDMAAELTLGIVSMYRGILLLQEDLISYRRAEP